jgi:predicted amidohydrolase
MVICAIPKEKVEKIENLPECDVAVFGFSGLGEVDYERELKGFSDKLDGAIRLSQKTNCVFVGGCFTISRGIVRKSVAVCYGGRLLGITDMNHVLEGDGVRGGVGLGYYNVAGLKIGVCVENDLLFPEAISALAQCGSNVIIAICEELKDGTRPLLIRAYSYIYGVPIVMCAGGRSYFSEVSAEIACSNANVAMFEVVKRARYHLVTTRTRGIYTGEREDY